LAFTAGDGQIFELSHSLASGDSDDYVLKVHDRVGWCLVYDDASLPNNVALGDIQFPPGCFVQAASGDTSGYGDVPIKSISSQFGGNFVSLTCEVQKAKLTGAAALSARLEKADLLLGSATGSMTSTGELSLPVPGLGRHLLQTSVEEARAFISEVNEHSGEIDANNGRGTAARWIGQAQATIAEIEKLLDDSAKNKQ
jgi:hypothetical protein